MQDDHNIKPDRSLSEISHLFLSSVRERHTNGAPRPVRRPPGQRMDATVDLTPEEYAEVFGEPETEAVADDEACPAVSAVIAGHLAGDSIGSVRAYARHLAAQGRRVGLVVVDSAEFHLSYFDQDGAEADAPAATASVREIAEAIEELSFEVDRWLVLLPNPRSREARALLSDIEHWTLLATCDHDGVVASYRAMKGLSDVRRPVVSLAMLDAVDQVHAAKVFRKLASVCRQFLSWPVAAEPLIRPAPQVAEHAVGTYRPAADVDPAAAALQWQLMTEFVTKWQGGSVPPSQETREQQPELSAAPAATAPMAEPRQHIADVVVPEAPRPEPLPSLPMNQPMLSLAADVTEVVELQDAGAADESILASVLKHARGEIVECPVQAPMCPQARLAVGRDSRLVMLAIAKQGLGELNSIGQAYRWMNENRALIRMAVPQLAINDTAMPALRLLVDHADANATVLQPMLQTDNVTVQAYRRLRWGAKTGLLLEAA